MAERCSVLCQHPGCWDTAPKVYKNNAGHHSKYLQYIDYLIAKKKATVSKKRLKPNDTCLENGLPYLTVSELIPSDLNPPPSSSRSHRRPSTQSLSLERRRESINSTASTMRFSLSSPLHGDRGHPPSSPPQQYSEYWFTPTLVWQPNKRSRKTKKLEEKKQDRILKTTNLTDVLPPVSPNHGHSLHKDKRPLSKTNKRSKNFKLSMDQYIMEGLSDVPPNIVDQIIQELHSHRYADDIHGEYLVDNNPSNDQLLPLIAPSPPRFPSPLIFGQPNTFMGNTSVPSSTMIDIQSKKVQQASTKDQKRCGGGSRKGSSLGLSSYSRALAQQPQKALTGLKIRVAQLQVEDEHYYLTTRPSIDPFSKSTDSSNTGYLKSLYDRTSPVKTGPSYFTPRSLNKATLQRLNCGSSNKGVIELSKSKTLGLAVSNKPFKSIDQIIPVRPSIHIPLLPLHESPFSEDFGSHPDSCIWPDSRSAINSGNASSHQSSDHLIVSADLATQTGELLLMNRAGEVIHQVKETDVVKTPKKDKVQRLAVDLGPLTTPPENNLTDPTLGSVAPPPTAISNNNVSDNSTEKQPKND